MDQKIFLPSILESSQTPLQESNLIMRPLSLGDFEHGYTQLLGQLTDIGDITKEKFTENFNKMKKAETYYTIVIEDSNTRKIIASTTLFLEFKFIHSCSLRGRIEDVVVDDGYRGKGLGKGIVESAVKLARHLGCYKVSLDCRDQMMDFYQNIGFVAEKGRANMLVIRF